LSQQQSAIRFDVMQLTQPWNDKVGSYSSDHICSRFCISIQDRKISSPKLYHFSDTFAATAMFSIVSVISLKFPILLFVTKAPYVTALKTTC
uniref:Ovule protein n=1 Tax=Anisakis simplex TaxID=6269 RepID=A0A0M3JNW8_ANISI